MSSSVPVRTETTIDRQSAHILARDGMQLVADIFLPAGIPIRACMVLNGATGVRRQFYARFAHSAAMRGLAVVTYDYRGVGESLVPAELAASARMRDWGQQDLPAVIQWSKARFPGATLHGVGHSVGGQLFGLTPAVTEFRTITGVAAQSGYWRLWPRPLRRWLTWYLLVPGLTRMFGHLPGWSGMGMRLPAGVALEWARWCRSPAFFVDEEGAELATHFHLVRAPVFWVAIEGDPFAPQAAVDWMGRRFVNAAVQGRTLGHGDGGDRPMGHFGAFTAAFSNVWDTLLEGVAESPRARDGS